MMAAINSSEIDANLSTKDERVCNPAGAVRTEDILQVRLKVERALEQSQAVSELHHRLVRLQSNIWIQLLRPPLKILQVIAKMTVDNAQADYVDRTRGEDAARNKSSREKIGHPADGLIGRH